MIKININLSPSVHISIEIKFHNEEKDLREKKFPVYFVPKITYPQWIQNWTNPNTGNGTI